ncbi:MAG: hypothetical protein COT81_05540 [Candidatus Buchananbacteria bacterium CG10_big_fil_rev_8_21_14_0_10_42_9]|uniref:Uncharacterized protein n=1 Tax=Candidatus Buchananbacteria bacterium CG10_big_fil_rev_8_21_14_0_10_42_9 TaxID=1974526 RepID=A0A2H0VZT8_9BACT|nr:MAG: hypothetical protein COT81_05540 [Candidatus Buchananbacteria bacterium CG10_big_fil_rev_8_21_14_0_10_42_9]
MNQYIARLNQFVIAESDKDGTVTKTLVGTPNPIQLNHLGQIFGLIDIREKNPSITDFADFVLQEFERIYYQQLDLIEDLSDLEAVLVNEFFEQALQDTNTSILNYLEQFSVTIDLKKINIILGVTKNQDLHFTQVGDIHAFLIHQRSKSNYTIIDIVEKASGGGKSNLNPLKFFSQIISGKITQKDTLILLTASVLDYFSLEKLKNIFGGKPIVEATLELKQIILDTKSPMSFAGATLQVEKLPAPLQSPAFKPEKIISQSDIREAASQDSIKQLIDTEKATEKLLNTTVKLELKRYSQALNQTFKNYFSKVREISAQKTKSALPKSPALSKGIKATANKLKPVSNVTRASVYVTKTKIGQAARHPIFKKIGSLVARLWRSLLRKFQSLPTKQKAAVVLSIILAIVLLVSLIRLTTQKVKGQRLEAFQTQFTQAQELYEEAEASIIFNDEDRARQRLKEAEQILTGLEAPNKSLVSELSTLEQTVRSRLTKLRHIVEIAEPAMITNFQNLDEQAEIAPAIGKQGQIILTQNSRTGSLYKTNTENFVVDTISSEVNLGKITHAASISPNSTLWISDSGNLFQYSAANDEISQRNWNNSTAVDDIEIYNNTLYHLSKTENQIYRSSVTGNGYGTPQAWITNQVNIDGAVSLAIDGFIYVLKTDGKIIKLLRGGLSDYSNGTIDPPIERAVQIWTEETSDYLYLLAAQTRRVIVMDKEGSLIIQYHSDAFDDLKDLVVDEAAKQIYILNGSKIFGIPATHLE